jgi:C-terminal processing protease CtpA/Prc
MHVTLQRNRIGQLGFTLDGVRVARIIVLQPAEGQLRVGDQIISVNGTPVTPETAVNMIRAGGQTVELLICRE